MSSGPPLGVLFALAALCALCSSSSAAAGWFTFMGDSGSLGGSAPAKPSGQYIKIVQTVAKDDAAAGDECTKNKIINLAEVKVLDASDVNLAAGKTVTGTAFHPAGPLANLVDGNLSNFAHTACPVPTNDELDFMKIDLGSVKEITKIVITNRTDCCQDRAIGIKVQIVGSDGTTVVKETPTITTTADSYTFTFPGTAWS